MVDMNQRKRLSIVVSERMRRQLKDLAKKKKCTLTTLVKRVLVKMIVNETFIAGKYPNCNCSNLC